MAFFVCFVCGFVLSSTKSQHQLLRPLCNSLNRQLKYISNFALSIRLLKNSFLDFLFAPRVVSVRAELALGHLRYSLANTSLQLNSPPGSVLRSVHAGTDAAGRRRRRSRTRGGGETRG
jgi:hypothetical protein